MVSHGSRSQSTVGQQVAIIPGNIAAECRIVRRAGSRGDLTPRRDPIESADCFDGYSEMDEAALRIMTEYV